MHGYTNGYTYRMGRKMGITEFLEARIDEDEARAGSGWTSLRDARWETDNYGRNFLTPSAVLAECATKRALIERAAEVHDLIESEWGMGGPAMVKGWESDNLGTEILRALASSYANHPDYQQEWAA